MPYRDRVSGLSRTGLVPADAEQLAHNAGFILGSMAEEIPQDMPHIEPSQGGSTGELYERDQDVPATNNNDVLFRFRNDFKTFLDDSSLRIFLFIIHGLPSSMVQMLDHTKNQKDLTVKVEHPTREEEQQLGDLRAIRIATTVWIRKPRSQWVSAGGSGMGLPRETMVRNYMMD